MIRLLATPVWSAFARQFALGQGQWESGILRHLRFGSRPISGRFATALSGAKLPVAAITRRRSMGWGQGGSLFPITVSTLICFPFPRVLQGR
jgi:hypothetical protein